jgi:DNA-binding MarR family transcriptional regulator
MTKAKPGPGYSEAASDPIVASLADLYAAREAFDEAVGNKLGLIVAERRCVIALMDGPKAAGALAEASGLTPAAATSMIDRLETRGFVERQRDVSDRRKVFVALTKPAAEAVATYYAPLNGETANLIGGFNETERDTISRFLASVMVLHEEQTARLAAEPGK